MKCIFVLIVLSVIDLCLVSGLQYYYIKSDESIHSGLSSNGSITGLSNDTVATLIYTNNINKTGWANLELQTLVGFTDAVQAHMAGYIEGYITGDLIHKHFRNNVEGICVQKKKFCQLFKEFVNKNREFVENMIKSNPKSDYWHQLDLINRQIVGLEAGYGLWKRHNRVESPIENQYFSEIFLLNVMFELSEFETILIPDSNTRPTAHCTGFVKPLADGSDLFVAHNTWDSYQTMLRVMKRYSFAFNTFESNQTKRIAGHSVAFSSYPATIQSVDDYYILISGLVVMVTTNINYNKSLYKNTKADKLVFEFARNILANRLATTGREWTQLMMQYNSGTNNNQYMIVDYNRYKLGTNYKHLSNDLLWICEQMPGFMSAADVTPVLRAQGYWASYNVPFFPEINRISGNAEMEQKFGPYYSHSGTARAKIIARDESSVTDLKTLYALMRYNHFKTDPLSQCQTYNLSCSPAYLTTLTLAARNDLDDEHGHYPFDNMAHSAMGAVDAKMTTYSMVQKLEMLAISGPTAEQQPPFNWSKSGLNVSHSGHPNVFDFKPIYVKWFPNSYEIADNIQTKV